MKKPAILIGAVLVGGLFIAARRAQAGAGQALGSLIPDLSLSLPELPESMQLDVTFADNPVPTWAPPDMANTDRNVAAFLAAIAWAEGTDREREPYRVCYGYRHTVRDLSEHPAVSGEWSGEPLDNLGGRYLGMRSTAAGRYQMIKRTWMRARDALGLRDFGPASQDRAAVWLIEQRGALQDVQAGRFDLAAQSCASEWASLPASTAGQPTRQLASLRDVYQAAGGVLA